MFTQKKYRVVGMMVFVSLFLASCGEAEEVVLVGDGGGELLPRYVAGQRAEEQVLLEGREKVFTYAMLGEAFQPVDELRALERDIPHERFLAGVPEAYNAQYPPVNNETAEYGYSYKSTRNFVDRGYQTVGNSGVSRNRDDGSLSTLAGSDRGYIERVGDKRHPEGYLASHGLGDVSQVGYLETYGSGVVSEGYLEQYGNGEWGPGYLGRFGNGNVDGEGYLETYGIGGNGDVGYLQDFGYGYWTGGYLERFGNGGWDPGYLETYGSGAVQDSYLARFGDGFEFDQRGYLEQFGQGGWQNDGYVERFGNGSVYDRTYLNTRSPQSLSVNPSDQEGYVNRF